MPDLTRNERIALKRGYLPPGHPKGYMHTWCNPSDSNCALAPYHLPQFDTDPAAAMELLESCEHIIAHHLTDEWCVMAKLEGTWSKIVPGATLRAAIAEAYLEASGG